MDLYTATNRCALSTSKLATTRITGTANPRVPDERLLARTLATRSGSRAARLRNESSSRW